MINNPLPERQNFCPTGKQGFPTRKILKNRLISQIKLFEIINKNDTFEACRKFKLFINNF